jgi:hypothetical protein
MLDLAFPKGTTPQKKQTCTLTVVTLAVAAADKPIKVKEPLTAPAARYDDPSNRHHRASHILVTE